MKITFLGAFAAVFQAMATLASADSALPVPEIEKLQNGLEVAWFVNDNLPIVDLAVLVKSGFRDDPTGKSGTAELVGNSLDRGAAGMDAQQIAHAVEMLGASRYASADDDTFTVGMHGLASDSNTLLDLLGKLVIHPDFPEAEVKREQDRLLDRWSHIEDYGETLVSLAFSRIIAAGTAYGRGNFLSIDEFKKVTRDDVISFHQKNFTPQNSILMVVGRVDRAQFKKRIETVFGDWKASDAEKETARKKTKNTPKTFRDTRIGYRKGEIVIVDRPNLTQAQVRLGLRSPLIDAPEHYSLVVANALLGEYFNSRLNSLIRDKLGLTYSISSSFGYSRSFASFMINSATRNETVGQLIVKVREVLKDLKRGPIPSDEVNMAKDYLVGGFPLATSTLGAVAARWLAGYVFDLGPNYLNEFVPKVKGVATQDVLKAVNKDLDPNQLVIVVAGDAAQIEKSLKAAKITSFRRVSVRDLL